MSFLDRITSRFKPSVKESATARAVAFVYSPNQAVFEERNFLKGARVGFENNVTVYSCVMEVARAVASIDWEVKLIGEDWSEVDAPPSHPLNKLLERPNEQQGKGAFFEAEVAYFLLSGNSYIEGTGNGDIGQPMTQPPTELHVLRPDRVAVRLNQLGGIGAFEHKVGGIIQRFDPSRVLHRKSFNPTNDFYGFAPLLAAAKAITADNSAQDWNVSLLQNSGRPSGLLVSKGSLSDEQFNRIKTEVDSKYSGPMNAGRIMVADGEDGLEWTEMSSTPKELEWLEGRKMSKAEICQAFQVPSELIGDSANKTYANYQEARTSFWTETVLAYADRLRDDLNRWLAPLYGDNVRIQYDKSEIDALQEDSVKVWDRAGKAVADGRLTPNEARALMGYEEAEDALANERLVPVGLVPASEAGAIPDAEEDVTKPVTAEPIDDEGKSFEVLSGLLEFKASGAPTSPALYWKAVDASRNAWERRATLMMEKQLLGDERAVVKAVRGSDHAGVLHAADMAIEARKESWREFITDFYIKVGKDFAKGTQRALKSAESPAETKLDDEAARLTRLYIEKIAGKKIEEISRTSLLSVRRAIKAGLDKGEGTALIAKRIAATTAFSEVRARTIARTEVIAASNQGSLSAAQSTGANLAKVWVTTIDDRTRGIAASEFDHFAADEQRVETLDAPFVVSGEELNFPADSSLGASAGNVINCRCAVVYERADEPQR